MSTTELEKFARGAADAHIAHSMALYESTLDHHNVAHEMAHLIANAGPITNQVIVSEADAITHGTIDHSPIVDHSLV